MESQAQNLFTVQAHSLIAQDQISDLNIYDVDGRCVVSMRNVAKGEALSLPLDHAFVVRGRVSGKQRVQKIILH
jgi:hypothetical protein